MKALFILHICAVFCAMAEIRSRLEDAYGQLSHVVARHVATVDAAYRKAKRDIKKRMCSAYSQAKSLVKKTNATAAKNEEFEEKVEKMAEEKRKKKEPMEEVKMEL